MKDRKGSGEKTGQTGDSPSLSNLLVGHAGGNPGARISYEVHSAPSENTDELTTSLSLTMSRSPSRSGTGSPVPGGVALALQLIRGEGNIFRSRRSTVRIFVYLS